MKFDFGLQEFFYRTINYYLKDSLPKKARKKISSFLEKTVYFFAIIGPLMTLPQIYMIWTTHLVAGFSLITWISYMIISIFWLFLGVFTKNRPIIFANFFWVIIHIFIVINIILYG